MNHETTILNSREAWEIANKAFQLILEAEKAGVISIVSSHGRRILQFAMNGITPYNAHLSEQKARQATTVGRRTRFIRDKVNDPNHPYTPRFLNIPENEFVPWAGGVPIFSQTGIILGGIGICITTEDEDEAIAIQSVEDCDFLSDRVE